MMKIYFTLICLCGSLAISGQVYSQSLQSISQGFSAHVHGQFVRWNSNSFFLNDIASGDPSGVGFGVGLRYGFTSMMSGYLAFEGVNFNSNDEWERYNTKLYRFGGQYNFGGTTSRIRPYIHVGGVYQNFNLARIFINGTQPVDNGKLTSKGFAVETGAGIRYHILPEFAAELSISGQFGKYGSNFVNGQDYDFEETIDTQHVFVRLGVGYFFY